MAHTYIQYEHVEVLWSRYSAGALSLGTYVSTSCLFSSFHLSYIVLPPRYTHSSCSTVVVIVVLLVDARLIDLIEDKNAISNALFPVDIRGGGGRCLSCQYLSSYNVCLFTLPD